MLSFWINYGALLHLKAPTVYALPLALQCLPAVFLIAGMLIAPERYVVPSINTIVMVFF